MAQVYTHGNPAPTGNNAVQHSLSRRQKLVRAITNPDQIFQRDPSASSPPTSKFDSAKLNESKLARALFSPALDVSASNHPVLSPISEDKTATTTTTTTAPLPRPDEPLWPARLLDGYLARCAAAAAADDDNASSQLPAGYAVRPLARADYHRGYLDVLRVQEKVGWVGEREWDERCAWLRDGVGGGAGTYYTVVICDGGERVVAVGTLLVERGFSHGMGPVAHLRDVAVSRDQKGLKMGLRILEALIHVAREVGCCRCAEQNESFYGQCGFAREGIFMSQKLVKDRKDEEVYS